MLKDNFFVSGNDNVVLHDGLPPWSSNTWNKDNWINNSAYWNVWRKVEGNKTYWRIQYGFDSKPFASVKFQYFHTVLENLVINKDNSISFTIKYYFTFLCNRLCTTNNGGYEVHNEYWIKNHNIYSLDYNTASNNTWDNESDPYYYRFDYTLQAGEELNLEDMIKVIFDYKGVVPNSQLFMGVRYKNELQALYYPAYQRLNSKKIDNGFIKNRLKTLSKDNRKYQNQVNKGNFRYRKNNGQYQINEVK